MPRSVEASAQRSHVLTEIAGWTVALCAWLLACAGIVCLLFSLRLEPGPHRQPQLANQSAEKSRESVPFPSHQGKILPTSSSKLIRTRASPRESFCPPGLFLRFLSADDVSPKGPPWLNYRGPPGTWSGTSVSCTAAGQTSSPRAMGKACFFPKFRRVSTPTVPILKIRGFCNRL
jgi:hypothetical protein